MKTTFLAIALFAVLSAGVQGCEKKSDSSGYKPPSINYVCRASQAIPGVPGLYPKGTDGKLYPSTADSKSAAMDEVRMQYMGDHPDAKRVQVACFDCDIVKDVPGRKICDGE